MTEITTLFFDHGGVLLTNRWDRYSRQQATLNNESAELNQARIDRFDLRRYFATFFSSGFLGVKKPDQAIYRACVADHAAKSARVRVH